MKESKSIVEKELVEDKDSLYPRKSLSSDLAIVKYRNNRAADVKAERKRYNV